MSFDMANDLCDVDRAVMSLKASVVEDLAPSVSSRLEICASEWLTNLVKYAQGSDAGAPIHIAVSGTSDVVVMDIFDPQGAAPFDPRGHGDALDDVDPFAENGRGLGLILHCADTVNYGPKGGRMCLSLTFLKSGE